MIEKKGATILNIMTFSMKGLFVTLSIMKFSITLCHYAECNYVKCRILFILMQNVITLSVIILSVAAPGKKLMYFSAVKMFNSP